MNTRGVWQKDIIPSFQDHAIRYVALDFGWEGPGVLFNSRQTTVACEIYEKYLMQSRFADRPGFVAHSFGTACLARLFDLVGPGLIAGRLILAGSILPRSFDWPKLKALGCIEKVLNEVAGNDVPVRLARFIIPNSGPSGRYGFENKGDAVVECVHDSLGHSGVLTADRALRAWIPFLRHGTTPKPMRPN
jgi:hypothetical protein